MPQARGKILPTGHRLKVIELEPNGSDLSTGYVWSILSIDGTRALIVSVGSYTFPHAAMRAAQAAFKKQHGYILDIDPPKPRKQDPPHWKDREGYKGIPDG